MPMSVRTRSFLALLVASGGFVIVLDSFAAAVAFPRIAQDFPATPRTTLAWLSSGYAIALAALLLLAGKLADRYGLRRVYLTGMAGFVIGAVASAVAPNPALLITARVAQGCAGALMVSTSIALALLGYPPERRGAAMGAIGIMGSLASLAGPVLAGNIIGLGGSWRWVFLVSVPIGLVVLVSGPRVLPAGSTTSADATSIDVVGVVLVVLASGLLTLGMLQSGAWGWADRRTLGALGLAAVTGALFVQRCRTARAPLLRLEIFRERRFLTATVSQLGSQLSIFAFFFWIPLFLTNVWHWSAAAVGWVTAVPLVVSFSSLPIGRFGDRGGYRGVLVVGGLVGAASLAWMVVAVGEEPRLRPAAPGAPAVRGRHRHGRHHRRLGRAPRSGDGGSGRRQLGVPDQPAAGADAGHRRRHRPARRSIGRLFVPVPLGVARLRSVLRAVLDRRGLVSPNPHRRRSPPCVQSKAARSALAGRLNIPAVGLRNVLAELRLEAAEQRVEQVLLCAWGRAFVGPPGEERRRGTSSHR